MRDTTKHGVSWYIFSFLITGFVSLYAFGVSAMSNAIDLGPLSFLLIWGRPFVAICCITPAVGFFAFFILMHLRVLIGGLTSKQPKSYWRIFASLVVIVLNVWVLLIAGDYVLRVLSQS